MNIINILLVFIISFLLVTLISLPIGIKVPKHHKRGHATSCPENNKIILKLFISTIISLIITSLYFYFNQ